MIELIITGVLCFFVGWKFRGSIMISAMKENPEKIIQILKEVEQINKKEKTDSKEVEVEPEKVGQIWYAYAKETGQFLAQAPTLEEAIKLASLRFPNKTFWCETEKSNLTKSA